MNPVIVTGANGMLGKAVGVAFFRRWRRPRLLLWQRDICTVDFGRWLRGLTKTDDRQFTIINCAGKRPGADPVEMIRANALGPYMIADAAVEVGYRVIHVSTDCVHGPGSGSLWKGGDAKPSADDLYGQTKALGEVDDLHVLNVRTSFVGPDHGLWWWLAQEARLGHPSVDGWQLAYWSGSSVYAVADALVELSQSPLTGETINLATEYPIAKAEALMILASRLGLDISVRPVSKPVINHRILRPDIILPPLAEARLT